MLLALVSLATQQAAPTENTMTLVKQFLDYAATRPDAIITYHASDIVLSAHSDASYLSESKAISRAGGHFLISNDSAIPANNIAVVTISQINFNLSLLPPWGGSISNSTVLAPYYLFIPPPSVLNLHGDDSRQQGRAPISQKGVIV